MALPDPDGWPVEIDEQAAADIAAEVYVHSHFHPALTDEDALQWADMVHDLITGDWLDE